MTKVLVGLSGGVDSAVSAFLLKKSGYEVCAVTMCLGCSSSEEARPRCCGSAAIQDARKIADKLGIAHYIWDFSRELEEKVIRKFISEYQKGRTPNPCVECNKYLKFGKLLQGALNIGFDYLATGHYAKIEVKDGNYFLKRPRDKRKDQTYFLYSLRKEDLKFILFPLADYTKEEVRAIARREGLPVSYKPQSQDICFIGENYRQFLKQRIKVESGEIVDSRGRVLGEHRGLPFYTIGQRQGLGISCKQPLYVIGFDLGKDRVIVGQKEELKARGLLAEEVNVLKTDFEGPLYAQIRYRHTPAKCWVEFIPPDRMRVIFEQEQYAVTPGQSVVIYKEDYLIAGGIITSSIRSL